MGSERTQRLLGWGGEGVAALVRAGIQKGRRTQEQGEALSEEEEAGRIRIPAVDKGGKRKRKQ